MELVIRRTTTTPDKVKATVQSTVPDAKVTHIQAMSGMESVLMIALSTMGSVASIVSLIRELARKSNDRGEITDIYVKHTGSDEKVLVIPIDDLSKDALNDILTRIQTDGSTGHSQ